MAVQRAGSLSAAEPEAELTATLQRLQVPCVIVERSGMMRWMNDAARSAFGDITGQHYSAVVVPEDVERVRKQIEQKAAGLPATDYEIDVVTADGRRHRAEVSSVPVRGAMSAQGCSASSGLKVHHERAQGGRR